MTGIELKGLNGLKGLESVLKEKQSSINSSLFLSIKELSPGRSQPRTVFDDISIENLASSIRENGIIQPLIVREKAFGGYEIIAGERRWRAAQVVGLNEVPAIIRNVTDEVAAALALIENVQREDLNPIDQAVALTRLVSEYSMTHEYISKVVGISRSSVTNLIRLLSLDENVQKLLMERKLETGHAKAMFSLKVNEQIIVSKKIVEQNLSVREVEKIVQKIKLSSTEIESNNFDEGNEIKQWNERLSEKLHRKVNLSLDKNGKGKIEIKFNTKEEARWLIDHLKIE